MSSASVDRYAWKSTEGRSTFAPAGLPLRTMLLSGASVVGVDEKIMSGQRGGHPSVARPSRHICHAIGTIDASFFRARARPSATPCRCRHRPKHRAAMPPTYTVAPRKEIVPVGAIEVSSALRNAMPSAIRLRTVLGPFFHLAARPR